MKTQSRVVSISGVTVKKYKHQNKVEKIKGKLRDFMSGKACQLYWP